MGKQNITNNTKHNFIQNEEIIAKGIISLMRNGCNPENISSAKISRATGLDPDVVQDHMKGGHYYERNIKLISEKIKSRTSIVAKSRLFVPVFLSCVSEYRDIFDIEFERGSNRLHESVMALLKPDITAGWQPYLTKNKDSMYRVYWTEIFFLLKEWSKSGFSDEKRSGIEADLLRLTQAFSSGQISMIFASLA